MSGGRSKNCSIILSLTLSKALGLGEIALMPNELANVHFCGSKDRLTQEIS